MILIAAMAVLMPLLAALQFYWLGQVSDGERERLQANLSADAIKFKRDFNRELIRAYLSFHVDTSATLGDIERHHVERLEQWQRTAPYAQLFSDVFIVSTDEQGRPRPSRLDAAAKQFNPTGWSGEIANLRERFEQRYESARLQTEIASQSSLESFAADIPALIIPFPPLPPDKARSQRVPLPSGFTIITLNLKYMQREFIPSLIQRHFPAASETDYNLAIINRDHPQQVIYSSRHPSEDVNSSDVSMQIFGMDSGEIRTLRRDGGAPVAAGEQSDNGPMRSRSIVRYIKRQTGNSIAAASSGEEDGRWQLLITHQAGSLQAAVSSTRRRNLAISFGILLLLAASMSMTIVATRRAERLARQQINFVAGVSHELRTPLAVICSAGENLADRVVSDPRQVARYGTVIYKEGRRLTEMVEQVLEFAGAQSGRRRYEFRSTQVADLINGTLTACRAQTQESGFHVETEIESNLPPVSGDEAALKLALQNLISNTIKYDGESRWARLSAQMGAGERGAEVRITVEDRGSGIATVDLPHIFEPFYRGRDVVAAQIQGSGIGLSLVKQIAEAHGGRISVRSTPGAGSAFTLHLPVETQVGDTGEAKS